jgi:ribose-phosphate pyrophosphokinase
MSITLCTFPANEAFGRRLCAELGSASIGLEWRRFPDGESYVRYTAPLHGCDLAIVCTLDDPDSKALALLFAARTARELGAVRVGLVAPYLGYMRQDRRFRDGEAVTSIHFANIVSGAFDWLITVDPHLHRRAALAEIYSIPTAAVSAAPALAGWIATNVTKPLIVGPDSESEQWAAEVAAACSAPHAVMSKTRLGDRRVEIEAPPLSQWRDRTPVLLDDIISSARTMALAIKRIVEQGLAPPVCVGVHGIFSADAIPTLLAAGAAKVVTSNTIEHDSNAIDVSVLVARGIEAMQAHRAQSGGNAAAERES